MHKVSHERPQQPDLPSACMVETPPSSDEKTESRVAVDTPRVVNKLVHF
jgi:hypothetical protein